MTPSQAKSRRRVTTYLLLGGALIVLTVTTIAAWPKLMFLRNPEAWLHGVWEVDYEASGENSISSGMWARYDFERTGRLNASDGVCAGPAFYYEVVDRTVRLYEYEPLSDVIPLEPEADRPTDLGLGAPETVFTLECVNADTAALREVHTESLVLLRRVRDARHFYADG